MENDIYNFPKQLSYWNNRIKGTKLILPQNKEHLMAFFEDCKVKDRLSIQRILFYANRLCRVAELVQKDFKQLDEADFRKLASQIDGLTRPDGAPISGETKNIYAVSVKKFYKWLFDGECPKQVKEFFRANNKTEGMKPEDLLSFEEVKKLIDACTNPRDKAILSVLAETGARATELGTLAVKSVIFDKNGCLISIQHSKTTPRAVRMLFGTEYLRTWLSCHPEKSNPLAPLWVELEGKDKGKRLCYPALRAVVFRAKERAGIRKKTNLHAWRHYKATALAGLGLNETVQCEMMGWQIGSGMTKVYNHLSGKQVDDAYLSAMGLKQENERKEVVVKCPHCSVVNSYGREFCQNCNLPLNLTAAVSVVSREAELENRMGKLESDLREILTALQNKKC